MRKKRKKPVFEPFNGTKELNQFLDAESPCYGIVTEIDSLDLDGLKELENQLVEGICDYECIIEIELDSNNIDLESLKHDRKMLQRNRVELREVRRRIKMMDVTKKELIAS